METINNMVVRAGKGEEAALKYLHQRYSYVGDKFYEKNKDKISREDLQLIVEHAINEFCKTENNVPLALYIYKQVDKELRKRKEPGFKVRESVLLACQGDFKVRNELIEHYSTMVMEKAKKYDYMEYEDLVQFGMIKLIEYIDILIAEHQNTEFFTNGIGRAIDIYFNNTLRKEVELCNTPLGYIENDLENFIFEYEFNSVVNGLTTNEARRDIIKRYFLEGRTQTSLGEKYNTSHETVRKIVKLAQPQLKKVYLK